MTEQFPATPSQDEWIAHIYALAADPSRLLALRPGLEQLADHGLISDVGPLAYHFARAEQLVQDDAVHPGQALLPITRLDRRLHLLRPGLLGDVEAGRPFPSQVWMESRATKDLATLRDVARGALGRAFVQLQLPSSPARPTTFLVLPASGKSGGVDLHPIALRWEEDSGTEFALDFGLSDAETAVLRETLDRGDLRALAAARGTSLGTVRNQRKALMAKLDIASQNELIALYAGYRELRQMRPRAAAGSERANVIAVDGIEIEFRFIGPEGGRPVLYFHPLFGGAHGHHELERQCLRHHVRLLAPTRPYCGREAEEGTGMAMVEAFVDRVARALDGMGLAPIPVLGASGATPYALAFAKRHATRCTKVVIAGPTVPISSSEDLAAIGMGQRLPLQLARFLPSAMRLYVKAAPAVLTRRLDDQDYLKSFYRDSRADLEFIGDPANFAFIRASLEEQFVHGTRAGVEELLLNARDWSSLAAGVAVPVVILVGADDRLAPRSVLEAFAEKHAFALPQPLEGAGSFLLFQQPDLVLGALDCRREPSAS